MRSKTIRYMTILAGMTLSVWQVWAADTLADARAKVAKFKQELAAAAAAQQQMDEAGSGKHQAAAQAALAEARKGYDLAQRAFDRDRVALYEYAEVLRYCGDYDLVAETLKRVTRLEPENGEAWMRIGEALGQCGPSKEREAVAAARKAIGLMKASQDSAKAYAALGGLYRRNGLYDLARETFDAALRADSECLTARIGMAALNVHDGRPAEAEAALSAMGQVPGDAAQFLDRSLKESLDGFHQSRRFFPDTAANHLAYAKLLIRVGRMKEGIGPLERSATLDAKNPVTWNLLGSLSRYLGDTKRAREAFTQSLALKPDDARTQAELKALDAVPAASASGAQ